MRAVDTWIACAAAPFRRRLLGDWPDLLQDVRVELLRALRAGGWRGEARLKTYVWRVTTHTCIDTLRRHKRRPQLEPEEPEAPIASSDPSPLDLVVEDRRRRALLEALAAVPADCRDLWQRILAGLSYQEISRATGVAEGALRVRAHRCRKRAAELLGAAGPHDRPPAGGNAAGLPDAKG